MRYRPKNIGPLHIALGGLPDKMRVRSERGDRCVREERWRTSEAGGVAGKFGGDNPARLRSRKCCKGQQSQRSDPHLAVRRAEDIGGAFAALAGRADALYVAGDPLVTTNRTWLAILAAGIRLPTIHPNRENIDAGGLMSYGPNLPGLHRRAADFVNRILRGAKPADLPVEQPTKYELVDQPQDRQGARPRPFRRCCSRAPTR